MTSPSVAPSGPAAAPPPLRREAVLIIHGMGDQQPQGTLRQFIQAMLGSTAQPDGVHSFAKPERISAGFEQRVVVVPGYRVYRGGQSGVSFLQFPRRDYYELYWADLVSAPSLWTVLRWAGRLLWFRPKTGLAPRLASLRTILRAACVALFLAAVAVGAFQVWRGRAVPARAATPAAAAPPAAATAPAPAAGQTSVIDVATWSAVLLAAAWALAKLVGKLIGIALSGFTVNYVGDAYRYLHPGPEDVPVRQEIRRRAIDAITGLHTATTGPDHAPLYDAIYVVGHSLGSVVAYDALRFYWERVCWDPNFNAASDVALLRSLSQTAADGSDLAREVRRGAAVPAAALEQWRIEWAARSEPVTARLRELSSTWRVRRLITLGSPLASANLFLSTDGASFEQSVRERTLPTHPPTPDAGTIYFEPRAGPKDALECDRYLNHAAMFAVTDWVNIYSPQDLLAGPVTWFGPGVQNVRLADTPRRWFAGGVNWGPPLAHTDYWRFWPAPNNDPSGALAELRRALDIPEDQHRASHKHLVS